MRFLLDENFPLQLYRRLLETGHQAEHVIVLGQRGAPDTVLPEGTTVRRTTRRF